MIGFDITSGKRQRALLLHYGGEELEDIFDTLDNTGSADEIKPAIDALTEYFTPKKNTVYEAIVFRDESKEETHINESGNETYTGNSQVGYNRCKRLS